MLKIFETKKDIYTLEYDSLKDKYYLDFAQNSEGKVKTFYGDWALKKYLRFEQNFTEEQIAEFIKDVDTVQKPISVAQYRRQLNKEINGAEAKGVVKLQYIY